MANWWNPPVGHDAYTVRKNSAFRAGLKVIAEGGIGACDDPTAKTAHKYPEMAERRNAP
jgi:hypothetical protein